MRLNNYLNSIFIIIFLFFCSCTSKNTQSFINLKNAYIEWHFKNHITPEYDYSHNYFKRYNQKQIQYYIEDIKRFDLELSQINQSELNDEQRVDYTILKDNIDHYMYLENNGVYEKSLFDFISEIYYSIDLLISNNDIMVYKKTLLLDKHLDDILSYINNFKNFSYYTDENYNTHFFNENIDTLISYISEIPENLNLGNLKNQTSLNNIDLIIQKIKKFKYWINYEYEISYKSNNNFDSA